MAPPDDLDSPGAPAEDDRGPMSEEKSGRRVLVIDDEVLVRDAMCDMLGLESIPFFSAEDGAVGLSLIEQHGDRIGLVILDLTMPGLSGEETFRKIRATAPELAIVLSSGHDEAEALAPFEGESVAGYLQKPYALSDMVELVRKLLG